MTHYTFRTWGGGKRTIEADAVTFEPGHVAFWRDEHTGGPTATTTRVLIEAVGNTNVHDLKSAPDAAVGRVDS